MDLVLSTLAVLAIIYVVPLVVYGVGSAVWGIRPPENASPARFLLGVLVTKIGTAIAFVAIYWLGRAGWEGRWLFYATIWFVMFAASEVGDVVSRRTTSREALLGVLSEAIYAPASALVVRALLGAA